MLLTISLLRPPAEDLGYLLHKHPGRAQTFELSFGNAHVFYPEVSEDRCTAALLLDVDPVELVRGRKGSDGGGTLEQYVNDRPYVASSFLSVALVEVYRSAMAGNSKDRPELAESALPLEATLTVVPTRGGEEILRRLLDDPLTASIPVVMVIADATVGQVQRLLSAGAAAYLTKPLDVARLLGLLDEMLATG